MSQIRTAVCGIGKAASNRNSSQSPLPLNASTRDRNGSRKSAGNTAPARDRAAKYRRQHRICNYDTAWNRTADRRYEACGPPGSVNTERHTFETT
jgi:hypothetical protein